MQRSRWGNWQKWALGAEKIGLNRKPIWLVCKKMPRAFVLMLVFWLSQIMAEWITEWLFDGEKHTSSYGACLSWLLTQKNHQHDFSSSLKCAVYVLTICRCLCLCNFCKNPNQCVTPAWVAEPDWIMVTTHRPKGHKAPTAGCRPIWAVRKRSLRDFNAPEVHLSS